MTNDAGELDSNGRLRRPVPDPTLLTTQQLIRENQWLREVIEARLDGMDKAIELLRVSTDKYPADMDSKVEHLESLHDEKFRSIESQFRERDVRTEQTSRDAKTAVDAALQAAKEAVGKQNDSFMAATEKSEAATTKQIDQLQRLLDTNQKATDDKITDVKDRITKIEGQASGAAGSWAVIVAVVSVGLVVAALIIGLTTGQ